ncbi:hypothetical protein HMPREF1549_02929 [Actinomyces johnsonii F0510]|uniref:Uncharacterized protein n=1 Tax=Actinomyces johnsonii F0510 TaxID=1227262 RepID=U1Q0P2_9ACTO|nr:hypothetical protein HMPREF1549_02929 [Actinomyces johnsonii F0510]
MRSSCSSPTLTPGERRRAATSNRGRSRADSILRGLMMPMSATGRHVR